MEHVTAVEYMRIFILGGIWGQIIAHLISKYYKK
jgi:hypothetical protein